MCFSWPVPAGICGYRHSVHGGVVRVAEPEGVTALVFSKSVAAFGSGVRPSCRVHRPGAPRETSSPPPWASRPADSGCGCWRLTPKRGWPNTWPLTWPTPTSTGRSCVACSTRRPRRLHHHGNHHHLGPARESPAPFSYSSASSTPHQQPCPATTSSWPTGSPRRKSQRSTGPYLWRSEASLAPRVDGG